MENFEHLYEECTALLPEKRKAKAERLFNKNDALLSATAGLMMKRVLGINDDGMLQYNEHGKPFFEHGPFFPTAGDILCLRFRKMKSESISKCMKIPGKVL